MVGKDLLSHLIDNNYNFTEEDIIFIAKNVNLLLSEQEVMVL